MERNRQLSQRFGDEGAVLVMALVILFVISLIIFGLLSQGAVNLHTTPIVRSRTDRTFAVDAAAERERDRLRFDPALCPVDAAAAHPADVLNFNNRNVTVQCSPQPGSDLGIAGWALIVNNTLSIQGGGTATIHGPVFAKGNINFASSGASNQLHLVGGGLTQQYTPSCAGHSVDSTHVTIDAPFFWQCTTAAAPDPSHALPTGSFAPSSAAPAPITIGPPFTTGPCRVFFPGKYTSATSPAISQGSDNYFVTGDYYFEGIGNWNVPNNTRIVGGTSGTVGGTGNCSAVSDALALAQAAIPGFTAVDGKGVEFIFGGSSWMTVNNNTKVELFSREAAAAGDTSTKGISFYAVPDTPESIAAGYVPITPGTTVLSLDTGGAGTTIWGNTYAPTANLALFASNNTQAGFQGGVVAYNFSMVISQVGTGIDIFYSATTHARSVLITATAPSAGEGDTVADVRLQIRDDTSPPTLVVQSWRTCARGAATPTGNPRAPYPSPGCP